MQWKIRPGPSRAWAMRKPSPGLPITLSRGTLTSSRSTSQWPPAALPIVSRMRATVYPGVSVGTRMALNSGLSASPPVRQKTVVNAARFAWVVNHL